jgi:hypothetical protein
MRKYFTLASKLALLLIIFGFFQPVACNFTGPEIVKEGFSTPLNAELVILSIMMIILVLLPIIALIRFKSGRAETLLAPVSGLLIMGISYIMGSIYNGDFLSRYYIGKGFYIMTSGLLLSLVLAIVTFFTKPNE